MHQRRVLKVEPYKMRKQSHACKNAGRHGRSPPMSFWSIQTYAVRATVRRIVGPLAIGASSIADDTVCAESDAGP